MTKALTWETLRRPDGVELLQARARNNSYYLIVGDEVRYASQAGNFLIEKTGSVDEAKRAAEAHADRYDTRA